MEKVQIKLLNNSGFKWYSETDIFVKGYLFDNSGQFFEKSNLINFLKDIHNRDDFNSRVKSANGCFSIIIKKESSVFLAVDKIRSFPLFYAVSDSKIIITDNTNIFEQNNSFTFLDESIIEFRATSFVSGKQTLLKNVFQVQAGEIVYIDEKISSHFYFKYSITNPKQKTARLYEQECETVITNGFKRLSESVKNRSIVVPLSGGFDSRLIAVMLKQFGHENVTCYTYGKKGNHDIAISKRVAELLGYSGILLSTTILYFLIY